MRIFNICVCRTVIQSSYFGELWLPTSPTSDMPTQRTCSLSGWSFYSVGNPTNAGVQIKKFLKLGQHSYFKANVYNILKQAPNIPWRWYILKDQVFWNIAPCKLAHTYRFGGAYCSHLQTSPSKLLGYIPVYSAQPTGLDPSSSQMSACVLLWGYQLIICTLNI
jgi:hypothetical protein